MTLEQIHNILTGITGYADKVAYYQFPEDGAPALPFIVYWETGANTFAADGIVYTFSREIDVELYTKTKSTTDEALVESALTNAGIYWLKTAEYIDDEKCWMITYSMEV